MTKEYFSNKKLIDLLDQAVQLANEFSGGCDAQFSSAEDFHLHLQESIEKYKKLDNTQIKILHSWFAPTSSWDTFVGGDGEDLANEIYELLSLLK